MYKILVCCFNPRSINNIHYGFIDAGCEVRNLSIDWGYAGKTGLLKRHLVEALDEFKPDFVYSYGWWDIGIELDEFLEVIKQKGLFHVYWAYDDSVCFESISMPMAQKSHLIFTTVEECIPRYLEKGIPAFLLLHGCYPPRQKKMRPSEEYIHDVVLLGNNYNIVENPSCFEYRINGMNNVLKPMTSGGFDLKVWGLWWTHWDRRYVLPEEFYGGVLPKGNEAEVYSSCKIALGLQSVGDSGTHFSVRTFEAMACGVLHLSQYSPALERFFQKGVHMEWSRSAEETLEIVRFYLSHERAREKVALKGQQEVYGKHTIVDRAREALNIVGKFL